MSTKYNNGRIEPIHRGILISGSKYATNGKLLTAEIYLDAEEIDFLRQVFLFAEEHGLEDHYGHAIWHIREGRKEDCETCQSAREEIERVKSLRELGD